MRGYFWIPLKVIMKINQLMPWKILILNVLLRRRE